MRAGKSQPRPQHSTLKVAQALWHEGIEALADPTHAADLARLVNNSSTALSELALRWPDPETLFKGKLGIAKRVAWSEPIPLPAVKQVGHVLGGAVNDVLLSAMAGARWAMPSPASRSWGKKPGEATIKPTASSRPIWRG